MDNIEGNIDIWLTNLFEQTVMPENHIPKVKEVQGPEVQVIKEVHEVNRAHEVIVPPQVHKVESEKLGGDTTPGEGNSTVVQMHPTNSPEVQEVHEVQQVPEVSRRTAGVKEVHGTQEVTKPHQVTQSP